MPTYEYKCAACEHQMEIFARMSDPPPAECEQCGGTELSKILFPVAVHYKGSGFYSTDYAGKKSSAPSSSGDSSGGSGSDSSSGSSDAPKSSDSTGSPSSSDSSSSSTSSSSDS